VFVAVDLRFLFVLRDFVVVKATRTGDRFCTATLIQIHLRTIGTAERGVNNRPSANRS
jgi:hypothetical protein